MEAKKVSFVDLEPVPRYEFEALKARVAALEETVRMLNGTHDAAPPCDHDWQPMYAAVTTADNCTENVHEGRDRCIRCHALRFSPKVADAPKGAARCQHVWVERLVPATVGGVDTEVSCGYLECNRCGERRAPESAQPP